MSNTKTIERKTGKYKLINPVEFINNHPDNTAAMNMHMTNSCYTIAFVCPTDGDGYSSKCVFGYPLIRTDEWKFFEYVGPIDETVLKDNEIVHKRHHSHFFCFYLRGM